MVKKLLIFFMLLSMAIPLWAGEKTVTISRNEGIYDDGTGVYYCSKGGITMTFSSGLNNVNYLVEHQQVVFDIFSTNYVIKKIKFNCLDNTTNDNLDCFYWGPSTIHECERSPYVRTGSYQSSGYIGTWTGGSTPSKYVKFETEGKPVRFGSVEITYEKEFGDIFEKVTDDSQLKADSTYVLVSQYASKAMGKEDYYGSDNLTTFTSTPVTLLDNNFRVKVTDEVQLMKLVPSGYSSRPWYIKVGDNYLRRRSGDPSGSSSGAANGQGYNLLTQSSVTSYEQYFRVSISVTGNINQNALIRFEHNSSETSGGKTFAIRHYNGGSLFRDMDYSSNNQYAANQRVYLYKPAQVYYVTTNCLPNDDSGYITLGEGVLNDGNGNYTSQQFDNVSFFVGPTEGWGVGAVTMTNLTTNEVTTLTPTATSDFGNDYQFPMPAANVSVTANFLQPYNIDTICNPANGGQFNFINGFTNFSGQYYSNEGKTVTFKPTAADGYIFNSVTVTDNGVTTTLTPDADGVYSFVMPGNAVTLTANFEEANDLYLLGTANGRTNWIPSGPKFTFDGTNNKYYIDVYFKGGNDDPQTDPAYGYFSLTKKIDEGGNWNNIQGYRLAAENNNTSVEDGYTGVRLYDDRPNNAFKIKPGVYRIEVNPEMTEMSIIEYPLTVTFTPASGTVVDAGDVVSFTSNLNDLVHGINSQEVQATFNSYDNWGVTTSDSTHTIINVGTTMVTGQSKIGYITATGTADYEIVGDLYLLGTANGMDSWQPYGPKFNYDATTETYSLDVYFTGLNVTAADEGYGYFSLSSVISDPNNPNWNDIPNSARYNAQYDDFPITGLAYNQSVTNNLYQTNPNYAYKIDPGVYTITVNKGKTEVTVTKHELTLTFDPASGATVAAGDNVTISSNLDALVHAINPNEVNATFMYATSTDGSLPTPNTQGSTVTITAEGATTTVNAEASLGYIVVPGNADYIVPAPTVYSITTQVTPSEAGAINVTSGAVAGETVTFTVTTNSGYQLDNVEVTYGYSQALLDYTYDPTTGQYSFIMPNDDVKIFADCSRKKLYMLGSIMCRNTWRPSGPEFTYDTENEEYYLDVYFKGNEMSDSYHNHFSLATEISDFDWTNSNNATYATPAQWAQVSGRLVAAATNTPVGDGSTVSLYPVADGMTADNAAENSFEIEPGVYRVTVNKDMTEMSIVQTPLHLYFNPVSGTTVQWGTVVKVTSDIDDYVQPIANRWGINEIHQSFTTNTDDLNSYHFDCDTAVIIKAGTTPVMATASVNFIHVEDTAYYYVLGPYNINTVCNPEGAGSITINGGNSACENQPVTFTVSTANPLYSVTDVVLSYVDENDVTQTFTLTPGINGVYSFVMPGVDVTVTANIYIPPKHNIYVEILPSNVVVGAVEGLPSPAEAMEGKTVLFRVRDIQHHEYEFVRYAVRLITNDTHDTTTLTSDNNVYSFVMPSEDVTIQVIYVRPYTVNASWSPEDGGSVGIESTNGLAIQTDKYTYDTVTFHVTPNADYVVKSISGVSYVSNGDGTYSFVMPASNVYINVTFEAVGEYQINLVNDPIGGGSISLSGHVKTENGNYYSDDGKSVIITPQPSSHWVFTGIDVVDSDNNPVDVTANANGTYTLIMPASDVTVTAHYSELPYNIYTTVDGSGSIELTGNTEYAGSIVTFALVPGDGYTVQSFTVKKQGTTQTIAVTNNGNGTYSFEMPAHDVEIIATFVRAYTVSTVCIPAEGGTVELTSGVTGNLAIPGNRVYIAPTPNTDADYVVRSVQVRNNENGSIGYSVIAHQDGTYSFEMPEANVTVEVYFAKRHTIVTVCDPVDAGEFYLNTLTVPDGVHAYTGSVVRFDVFAYDGYVLESVTITNHTTNEVTELPTVDDPYWPDRFSFEMPDADVTLTAHFAVGYHVTGIVIPEDGGAVSFMQELDNGYMNYSEYMIPGKTVITYIDIAPGYVFKSAIATLDNTEPEQEVTLIDDGGGMDWDNCVAYYDKHFVMPEADVTVTVNVEPYTPLRVIEHNLYEKANNGDTVVVSDDLVVVWAAKDYLWAKDLAESNYSVPLPDDDDEEALYTYANVDVRDYVKDDLDFQKHEWDQSNWVILDCSGLYSNITNVTERRKKLDDYVDHMIAGGTIKGVYQIPTIPDVDPTHIWFFGKFNHVIKLTEEPEIKDKAEPSKGYPGYMQDPREENKAFDYHYNHYIPTTFFAFNRSDIHSQEYTFEPGPKAVQWSYEEFDNLAIFILPPQDQEVAQVWAVYAGADTIEENGSTKLVDKFTVYEYYLDGYTSQNVYDLPGGFAVPAENWIYNRLNSGYTDESYGRPGKYDNEQTGSTKLMQDTAYLFHIAIKTMPYVEQLPEMRGPNKPAAFQKTDYYQIYPLDMDTHDGTVTANRVIWEVDPASREVESVRYYNVMGQESKTPFDGINIVVTRYTDGSASSKKIYR